MEVGKNSKTMAEVSKGYEEFIKGKELNNNGSELFKEVIKKASTIKPKPKKRHGSK